MGKSLIITEKPSVAQEFAKVLNVNGRRDGYIENDEYVITWCYGHLVGLVYPEAYDIKYKKWQLEDLPFLPRDYKYDILPDSRKQYDVVHGMLFREDIDRVYWAGDAGKEGQTIEENIRNFGGVRKGMEELRVWIDSQTEEEILRGIREAKPMSAYANLGNSGIMRTIEDYAMGINFSRVMSVKYGSLLNDAAGTTSYTAIAVGRVMTCVLGMVVIREREIRNFKETPFYRVLGRFTDAQVEGEWKAVGESVHVDSPRLYKENGWKEREDAEKLIESLQGKTAKITALEKSQSKKKAPPLFNLAELQAECAKRFKISPDETLQVAQDLYEKKLTTYPRTDARVLSTAVAKEITKNISRLSGYEPTAEFVRNIMDKKAYEGIAKTSYVDDSKITDHYAIIPTGQLTELRTLNALQKKVFDLIVRRFLSIFYPPAVYQNVKMTVQVERESFFSSAKVLKEPGYLAIAGIPKRAAKTEDADGSSGNMAENAGTGSGAKTSAGMAENTGDSDSGENTDEEDGAAVDPQVLLELAEKLKTGDEVAVSGYQIREGKTTPPKRYTSGSMVLAMENAGQLIDDEELRAQIKGSGIGTSATRAEIIKKLVRNKYLNLNQKTQVLSPENLGEMIYEVVEMTVPALLNPKMSASWEKGLDGITNGTVDFAEYRAKLEEFIRHETIQMIGQDLRYPLADKISEFAGKGAKGLGARKKIGISCPICGEELVTTPFGYGCSAFKKDKTGCNFNIGEIAGVTLSEEQVKELLTDGRTETIRDFKGKSGKKFDACLKFVRHTPEEIAAAEAEADNPFTAASETPVRRLREWEIAFDFENVEQAKLEGVACPVCGGEIHKTSFGFGCANYKKDDPESCRFSIGKLCGKTLSEKQVKELLTNGTTGTIYGFKSKAGKKFDAKVTFDRDENGKVTGLKFDFENLEPQVLKGVLCPLCQGAIVTTPYGWRCEKNRKDDPESCSFSVGSIASVKLKEAQLKQLLTTGKTDEISGFVAKTGMKFNARLRLEKDGRIAFDFPEKPKPQESTLECPKCGNMLMKAQWRYECECGFKVSHTVAGLPLTEEVMRELFTTGKTRHKIRGFTSKAGKQFDTCLKYAEGRIEFDFNNPGEPEAQAVEVSSQAAQAGELATEASVQTEEAGTQPAEAITQPAEASAQEQGGNHGNSED